MHTGWTITRAAMALLVLASACASPAAEGSADTAPRVAGTVYVVKDTTLRVPVEVPGTAAAVRQATLSTRLMGTVVDVLPREGDAVVAGQPLVRIDARDLLARATQVRASVAEAEAVHRDAQTNAARMRALYADSVATRAQLDAAETGLSRAEAAVRSAQAAQAELGAVSDYAVIRAPFGGIVTRRFVDPGAFATPGAPLVTVQDDRRLRVSVSTTPGVARALRRGQVLDATIEGRAVRAVVEGVIPAVAGNLYTINAIVANPVGGDLAGSAATLRLPAAPRTVLAVPARAVTRDGDLAGVTLRLPDGDIVRWVRLGTSDGDMVQVSAGLRAGDRVVVPAPAPARVADGN